MGFGHWLWSVVLEITDHPWHALLSLVVVCGATIWLTSRLRNATVRRWLARIFCVAKWLSRAASTPFAIVAIAAWLSIWYPHAATMRGQGGGAQTDWTSVAFFAYSMPIGCLLFLGIGAGFAGLERLAERRVANDTSR